MTTQDNEPINEKTLKGKKGSPRLLSDSSSAQLTPESARKKNWNTRFANIKHSFEDASEDDPSNNSRSPSMNRTQDSELQQTEFSQPPPITLSSVKAEEHSRGRDRVRGGNGGGRDAPAAVRSRDAVQCCREISLH